MRKPHSDFRLVVQTLHDAAGKLLSAEIVEDQLAALAQRPSDLFHGLDFGTASPDSTIHRGSVRPRWGSCNPRVAERLPSEGRRQFRPLEVAGMPACAFRKRANCTGGICDSAPTAERSQSIGRAAERRRRVGYRGSLPSTESRAFPVLVVT